MKITQTMDLESLATSMFPNGDRPDNWRDIAENMRSIMLLKMSDYGWQTTTDVEDAEWFSMVKSATDKL